MFHARAAQHVRPRRAGCPSRSTSSGCSARTARAPQLHVVTAVEPATGAVVGAQRLPPGVRRARGVPRSLARAERTHHRRPHGVHRPQRLAALAGGARPRERSRIASGAALDPCGAMQVHGRPRAVERAASSSDCSATRATRRRRARWSSAIAIRRRVDEALEQVAAASGTACSDTIAVKTPDRGDGPDAEPLAALPDARVPHLGPLGLLSVQRRVRLPRSAAGRAGAALRAPAHRARAHLLHAASRQFVEGRRAALVARARRPGRAHAVLGRSPLAASTRRCSTSRAPATTRCSTSRCRFSRAGC